jgi:Porin PorA
VRLVVPVVSVRRVAVPTASRAIIIALAGVGAFLLVLSALTKFYVAGQVIKDPVNPYLVLTLTDPNATYFSAAKLSEQHVPVTVTITIQGDVTDSSSGTAVWNEFQAVHDDSNNVNFNYLQWRLPFNRKTGELVNCCGAFLNSPIGTQQPQNRSVPMSGQGLMWPLGSQPRDYMLYDTTLAKAVPARYDGIATADGLLTYRYVETVAPQPAGTQTLPGLLVGMKHQAEVTLPVYYQAVITTWVDPVTGLPLDLQRNETLTLRDNTGATRLVLFRTNLKMESSSVAKLASTARGNQSKINLVSTILPLVLLLTGLVLLGAAIALIVRGRGATGVPAHAGGRQPVTPEGGRQPVRPEDGQQPVSQEDAAGVPAPESGRKPVSPVDEVSR